VARDGQGLLAQLHEFGAGEELVACDSANLLDMAAFRAAHPKVSGYLHAAGAGDRGLLTELEASRERWMLAPPRRRPLCRPRRCPCRLLPRRHRRHPLCRPRRRHIHLRHRPLHLRHLLRLRLCHLHLACRPHLRHQACRQRRLYRRRRRCRRCRRPRRSRRPRHRHCRRHPRYHPRFPRLHRRPRLRHPHRHLSHRHRRLHYRPCDVRGSIAAEDVDGDGNLDVLLGNDGSPGRVLLDIGGL